MALNDEAGTTTQFGRQATTPLEEHQSRRILLTSNGVTTTKMKRGVNKLISLRKKTWSECVFLYIADAVIAHGVNQKRVHEEAKRVGANIGFKEENCRALILENETYETIENAFKGVDVIYAEYGNTFALKFYLSASGAIPHIRDLVLNQGVIYIGSSAGAIVCGKTAGIAFWKGWDSPEVAGQEVDWTDSDMIAGLNLIDNMSIFPHHSNRFAHLVQTKSKEMDHKVIPLKDEEGLIFIDNEYRILTA